MCCACLFLSAGGALAQDIGGSVADLGWEEYHLKKLRAIPDVPSHEDMELLTRLAAHKTAENPYARSVGDVAWERLASLPDFPKPILDSIHASRAKWKAGEWRTNYDRRRFGIIDAMKKLEDPRVVGILGELLWDTERTAGENEPGQPSNAIYASRSLMELLESPPVQRPPEIYRPGDLETWQLWYEQVRAGNRTFRFKGNPQEYNLLGPVSAATNSSGKPSPRKSSTSPTGVEQVPEPGVSVTALILSSMILGVAIAVLLRARKRKAG